MAEWQPIAGAPKTSRALWVGNANLQCTALVHWSEFEEGWVLAQSGEHALGWEPTHWRPTPEPPPP